MKNKTNFIDCFRLRTALKLKKEEKEKTKEYFKKSFKYFLPMYVFSLVLLPISFILPVSMLITVPFFLTCSLIPLIKNGSEYFKYMLSEEEQKVQNIFTDDASKQLIIDSLRILEPKKKSKDNLIKFEEKLTNVPQTKKNEFENNATPLGELINFEKQDEKMSKEDLIDLLNYFFYRLYEIYKLPKINLENNTLIKLVIEVDYVLKEFNKEEQLDEFLIELIINTMAESLSSGNEVTILDFIKQVDIFKENSEYNVSTIFKDYEIIELKRRLNKVFIKEQISNKQKIISIF